MLRPIPRHNMQIILNEDWYAATPPVSDDVYFALEDTSKPNLTYFGGGTLEEVLAEVKKDPAQFTWVPMEYVKEHLERCGYKITVL